MKLRLIYIGLVTMLLTACTAVTDGDPDVTVPEVSKHYINLSIAVANNNGSVTRGTPLGGEDGDGREPGFARENAVTGITLILYQTSDAAGINTTTDPTIDFVAYYPVTRTTNDTDDRIEATYQTGDQLMPHNAIDYTKTYRAIVVANADLTGSVTAGTSTLNTLRNMTLNRIYSGDETTAATACGNFVMSSEQDQTLNFAASGIRTQDAAGDYYYNLTDQPLVIERLAARIDFWAVNGTYNADKAGYVYNVGSTSDRFVVTGIMPFNLNNGTNIAETKFGNEYLLKRLTASLSTITPQWLIDETTGNYVLDPQTASKVTATHPLLTNSLESVKALTTAEAFSANRYYKSIATMHAAVQPSGTSAGYVSLTDGGKTGEDVIVAYPMENTLLTESPLYYHATGIAIEGYYYKGGLTDASPKRMVYYGYLRHQGEGTSYDITTTNDPTADLPNASTAMNFGIVRNNIYRVSIESIAPDGGTLKLTIAVHDWRNVQHPIIYI